MAIKNAFKVRKGLIVHGSGSTILDVQGSEGQLFSVTDSLVGSLFSVNDISGTPILEVFSDDIVKLGTSGDEGLIVSGNNAIVGNNLQVTNDISASNFDFIGSGSISKSLTIDENLLVSGDISSSNFEFDGSGSISKSLTIDKNLLVSGDISSSNFDFQGSGSITGDLSVDTDTLYVDSSDNKVGIGTNTPSKTLTIEGDISSSGIVYLENGEDKYLTTNTFAPDFGGFGARLETGISGSDDITAKLTLDELVVRKRLSVYELLINQIRATNGSLFVSSVGRIYSASLEGGNPPTYSLFFDTGSAGSRFAHGFQVNDLILAQRIDPTITEGSNINNDGTGRPQEIIHRSEMKVTQYLSSGSLKAELLNDTTPPEEGFDYVRLGNIDESDRQGTVYLTADDENAPYIDVVDGVTSHDDWFDKSKLKVRMGKLDGVTETLSSFGELSGYGFWASGSAYLEGGINATTGSIGGVSIESGKIYTGEGNWGKGNTGFYLDSEGSMSLKDKLTWNGELLSISGRVTAEEGKIGGFEITQNSITSSNNDLVLKSVGQITGSNVLFTGGKISGSNLSIDVTNLTAKGNSVEISGSNFHLLNGNVTASNVDLSGKITATTGKIGGFEITSNSITSSNDNLILRSTGEITGSQVLFIGGKIGGFQISSGSGGQFLKSVPEGNFYLRGDAKNNQFFISSSKFNVKANGDITASNADITGKITAQSGTIGGFTITNDSLSSTNFYLSGSAGNDDYFISSSNFQVKGDGTVSANNVTLSGSFDVQSGIIEGALSMSNQGVIRIGDGMLIDPDGNLTQLQANFTGSGSFVSFQIDDTEVQVSPPKQLIDSSVPIELYLAIVTGSNNSSNQAVTDNNNNIEISIQSTNDTQSGNWTTRNTINYIQIGAGESIDYFRYVNLQGDEYVRISANIRSIVEGNTFQLVKSIDSASFVSEFKQYNPSTLIRKDGIYVKSSPNLGVIKLTGTGEGGSIGGGGEVSFAEFNDLENRVDVVEGDVKLKQDLLANQTVGGITAGTTIDSNTKFEDILRNILIKYIPPSLSNLTLRNNNSNQSVSARDVGNGFTIDAVSFNASTDNPNGNFPVSASFTASNAAVGTINYYFGDGVLDSSNTKLIEDNTSINKSTYGTVTFRVRAKSQNSDDIVSTTKSVSFRWRNYLAASSTDLKTSGNQQTDAQSILTNDVQDSQLDTKRAWTATCTAENDDFDNFTYIIYPSNYGDLASVVDAGNAVLGGFTKIGEDFNLENSYEESTNFRIYQSNSTKAFEAGTNLVIS